MEGHGEITFDEFKEVCSHDAGDHEGDVKKLFDMLDEGMGGTLHCDEMVHALRNNAEAKELASQFAALHDFVEFAKVKKKKYSVTHCTPRRLACSP